MQDRDQTKYTKQEQYKEKIKEKSTDNMQPLLYSHYISILHCYS